MNKVLREISGVKTSANTAEADRKRLEVIFGSVVLYSVIEKVSHFSWKPLILTTVYHFN